MYYVKMLSILVAYAVLVTTTLINSQVMPEFLIIWSVFIGVGIVLVPLLSDAILDLDKIGLSRVLVSQVIAALVAPMCYLGVNHVMYGDIHLASLAGFFIGCFAIFVCTGVARLVR